MRDLRPYRDAAGQRSIQSALKLWPAALLLFTFALVVRGQEAKSPLPPRILVDLNGEIEAERLDALVDLAGLIRSFSETDRHRSIAAVIPILINSKSPLKRALAARVFEYASDAQSGPALLEALSREKETAVIKAILYALARVPIP